MNWITFLGESSADLGLIIYDLNTMNIWSPSGNSFVSVPEFPDFKTYAYLASDIKGDRVYWVELPTFFQSSNNFWHLLIRVFYVAVGDNQEILEVLAPYSAFDVYVVNGQVKQPAEVSIQLMQQFMADWGSTLQTVKDLLEADVKITAPGGAGTPLFMIYYKKGTQTELMRKKLRDVFGSNVSDIKTILAQKVT